MSLLEGLQKKRTGLKTTNTLVKTSDGDVLLEKRNEVGDIVVERIARGPGYVIDTKPDLQMAHVRPGLLMGSQDVALDENILRVHNITHILSIGVPVPHLGGIKYTYIEALDLPEFDLANVFEECSAIIDKEINSGGLIFIHCNAGVSRSASVVIAYLMTREGIHYQQAFDSVKNVRPCIKPNEGFTKQLKILEKDLFYNK